MDLSDEKRSEFKKLLVDYLPSNIKHSWVDTIKLLKISPSKVIFGGIPHKIYRYEIKTNHESLLIKILEKLLPEKAPFSNKQFEYKIGLNKKNKKLYQTEFDLNQEHDYTKINLNKTNIKNVSKHKENNLFCTSNHLLDSFIPGKRNLLASRASRIVVDMPGIAFNPFIIYGDSGAGKSYLLEGIFNELLQSNNYKKNLSVSAENFLNDFINNLRLNKMKEFRDMYRKSDVFMLDDLEALLPSNKCQVELLHTIKALIKKKTQIVVVCEQPPTLIKGLNPGLRRILESGLTVDVGIPDDETKIKILENKAFERSIPFSKELANFLVQNIKGGVGSMEGVLMRLGVHASLLNEELTINLARNALKDWLNKSSNKKSILNSYHGKIIDENINKILGRIKVMFQITEQELISYRRETKHIKARQAAIYLLKNLTTLTLSEIGQLLGRNHSTVHSNLKKVSERMSKDNFFKKQMQTFLDEFDDNLELNIPLGKKQKSFL